MKITKFGKIIDKLIDNPCVMASSDIYAAGRDFGFDDAEANEFVKGVFKDVKTQMMLSCVFRSGFYRSLIAVQNMVEDAEPEEKQSMREIRPKEFTVVLPSGIETNALLEQILEGYENEGM